MSLLLSPISSSSSMSTSSSMMSLFRRNPLLLRPKGGGILNQQFSSSSTKRWVRLHQRPNSKQQYRQGRQKGNSENGIGFAVVAGIGTIAGTGSAVAMAYCDETPPSKIKTSTLQPPHLQDTSTKVMASSSSSTLSSLRTQSFPLSTHSHGKKGVRVLKVVKLRSKTKGQPPRHIVQEYNVKIQLYSDVYGRCYTEEDNTDLVATDTQKNTVYYVAKVCHFDSPEGFGALLCHHFLKEYPMIDKIDVDIDQVVWERASVVVDDEESEEKRKPHFHGFLKQTPEQYAASVSWTRPSKAPNATNVVGPEITSKISKMTVLKTTQSGFEGYLQDDYTLLPPTKERCMATEMDASWTYRRQNPEDDDEDYYQVNHAETRNKVRDLLLKSYFGPAEAGVYSPSLQATIYDAACVVLTEIPEIESITIHTPNLHYLPCHLLDKLGDAFEDDIFIPTSEPSGIITCTVVRGQEEAKKSQEN